MSRRSQIGEQGKLRTMDGLRSRGWEVLDLDTVRVNFPNADLTISKGDLRYAIQVKTSFKKRGYITGGSVNEYVCAGGPIFNRAEDIDIKANYVLFVSNDEGNWRFFIVPVQKADKIFRKNINAYFNTPKLDGSPKSKNGQCDIFIGRGRFPHAKIVPDQRDDVLPFENRWDLLDDGC